MKKAIAVFAIAVIAAAVHAQKEAEKPDPARVAFDEVHAYVLADLKSNGWANAADHLARYDQVLEDYPDAPRDVVRDLQFNRFFSLYRAQDYAGAIAAGEAYVADYSDARALDLANVSLLTGISYERVNNLAAAQSAYERALADYPDVRPTFRVGIQKYLADVLQKRGEQAASQAAYMTLVTNYAWYCSAKDENSVIWKVFDKVNPMLVDAADYRAFLEATMKGTRAIEENARFLGRVQSELEKIK